MLSTPLPGSLLPVVMVIRGFGQDYEIFYLVASVLLGRTSKLALSLSFSLPLALSLSLPLPLSLSDSLSPFFLFFSSSFPFQGTLAVL